MALASRVPVNRQMTMMLARASMPLSRPNPSSATDPAITAAPIATPPSMPIQARVSQDSIRASRARRSQSADPGHGGHRAARGGAAELRLRRDHGVSMCSRTV